MGGPTGRSRVDGLHTHMECSMLFYVYNYTFKMSDMSNRDVTT